MPIGKTHCHRHEIYLKGRDIPLKNNKILRAFIIGIVLLFFFHQAYSYIFKPVKTESAEYIEMVDGVTVNGVIIREETIVENNTSGVLHYEVSDGDRVAKDGTIAKIYDSAATSYTVSRIDEITSQINDIKALEGYNSVIAADLSVADSKVNEALSNLILSTRGGDYTSASSLTQKLTGTISRRQMITGEQTDFSARLSELETELSALSGSLPSPSGVVSAPVSGYFISNTDLLEETLSDKTAEELTPDFIKNIKPGKKEKNAIGKIVSGYDWLIAAGISPEQVKNYKVGDELTVHTAISGGDDLSVTVKAINMSEDRSEAVIVLSCSSVSRELASIRYGDFTIVNHTYRGLKVKKSALRIIDGKTGVYVLNGAVLKFVNVNVLYTDDDYIICEKDDSNNEGLRLYDDVVVKGKKLYDKKVVN